MGEWIRKVRAAGGFLAIVGLVGLTVLDAVHPNVTLNNTQILVLISLISALLGIDIMGHMQVERVVRSIRDGADAFLQSRQDGQGSQGSDSGDGEGSSNQSDSGNGGGGSGGGSMQSDRESQQDNRDEVDKYADVTKDDKDLIAETIDEEFSKQGDDDE